jgi:hypothetical protein
MQIRLTALVNWRIWLVDWQALVPYWAKSSQYESLKDEKLSDAFLDLWFVRSDGIPKFDVGHLDYWPKEETIRFGNGSHRTRVLAKYLRYVPISAHANCYRSKVLAPHFKRLVARQELIEFPNLPVLSILELRRVVQSERPR